MPAYLAVALGAESGRVLRGDLRPAARGPDRLVVEEVHRFANRPVRRPDGLYWDIDGLYGGVTAGLGAALGRGPAVASVGVDAWGNDFGLLDDHGRLLAAPWHHRTSRTAGMVGRLAERIGPDELYATTGTQFLPITTACQLLAMAGSPALAAAERLVLVPDLISYWLTGRQVTERTVASTSQLWDIRGGSWATGVIERLGLPARLFAGEVVAPGTPVGPLRAEPGSGAPLVVAVAGHDTASAVAAVPGGPEPFGYVSCGTWSLVGLETPAPITTPAARAAHFTNEAGVGDTVRFLSNVNGLWLLQECRRAWADGPGAPSYPQLTDAARAAPAFRSLLDPDHPTLLGVGDMPARIAAVCTAAGEPAPAGRAGTVRCILESLACRYRWALERAEALVGQRVEAVHVVGGGAANDLLCQLTADVVGRPVVAGPVEATAVGNLLVQAMADGRLAGLAQLREVVRASFAPRRHEPTRDRARCEDAYGRFRGIIEGRPAT
ncbi:MAG TPA: rhamnulokinase family protein [Pilimelia sp.]|nr:rhamnulokinase family protein [Pilimelia sp.]